MAGEIVFNVAYRVEQEVVFDPDVPSWGRDELLAGRADMFQVVGTYRVGEEARSAIRINGMVVDSQTGEEVTSYEPGDGVTYHRNAEGRICQWVYGDFGFGGPRIAFPSIQDP